MKTLFSVSVAVLALCGAGFGEAQVEQREQLLRSKLSPAQARALRQAVSAFEAQLDVPGSPEAALDEIFRRLVIA